MIRSVTFTAEYRCFKRGRVLRFDEGLNVLVGDNGSGKSTILQVLGGDAPSPRRARKASSPWVVDRDDDVLTVSWDSERGNLRTQSWLGDDPVAHLSAMFASHGQANIGRLNDIFAQVAAAEHPGVVLLDEPDAGLSLRNVAVLARAVREMAGGGWQVFVSTHHPDLIAASGKVIDLDRKRSVSAVTYLRDARGADAGDAVS